MEEDAAIGVRCSHVRCAAGDIVDPVTLECAPVLQPDKQQRPVVLSVTSRRPVCHAIKLVVRDCDVPGSAPSGDDELASSKRELVVVDPDPVAVVQGEEISSPDILRVCVGEVDVLNNDIADAAAKAQALAADDACTADTDNTLVAANVDRRRAGVVIGTAYPGAVIAGVSNPDLAGARPALVGSCPGAAALRGCCALSANKAPFTVDENDTGSVVGDPFNKSTTLV